MNAARRTLLSVLSAAGLSCLLTAPTGPPPLAHGGLSLEPAALAQRLGSSPTPVAGHDKREALATQRLATQRLATQRLATQRLATRQLLAQQAAVQAAARAALLDQRRRAAAQLRASRSRYTAPSGPIGDQSQTGDPGQTGDPRQAARSLLAQQGQSDQFGCLSTLWNQESGWNTYATNPRSGAYGIPQALPASKMASAGADWRTNPVTQVRWGIAYIASRYGGACAALRHSADVGWY